MTPQRRYADWRSIREPGVPVVWLGALTALLLGLLYWRIFHTFNYPFILGALFIGRLASNHLVKRRMAALHDNPEGGQFAATLVLSRECAYALDEGLIAFEDGWLVFSGQRCTFSVGASDVTKKKFEKGRIDFQFNGPGGVYLARLSSQASIEFTRSVKNWRSGGRQSEGAVFPPVAANVAMRRTYRAALSISVLAFLLSIAAVVWIRGEVAALSFSVIITSPMIFFYIRDAQRTLNLIDRGEPELPSFFSRPLGFRKRALPPRTP